MNKCNHYRINIDNDGQCCCNCNNQRSLRKHPWNKSVFFSGSIVSQVADEDGTPIFVCTAMGEAIAFDSKHGMCEMWEIRKEGENL